VPLIYLLLDCIVLRIISSSSVIRRCILRVHTFYKYSLKEKDIHMPTTKRTYKSRGSLPLVLFLVNPIVLLTLYLYFECASKL